MKATTGHKTTSNSKRNGRKRRSLRALPAIITVAGLGGLLASTAGALELGELRINSALGQPLRASIPYTLSPNEQLFDFCIFLRSGVDAAGVPTVSRAKISLDNGHIMLAGSTPILEPVLAMQLSVNCPYTARLAREYTLMMSPAAIVQDQAVQLAQHQTPAATAPLQNTAANAPGIAVPSVRSAATVSTAAPVAAARQSNKPTPVVPVASDGVNSADPIEANSRYFVQQGDSLSSIARRIENRPVGIWPAVRAIHAANPEAFVNGDINQLTAAVWLYIPDLVSGASGSAEAPAGSIQGAGSATGDRDATYSGFEPTDSAASADAEAPQTVDFVDEVVIEPIIDIAAEPLADDVSAPATNPAETAAGMAPQTVTDIEPAVVETTPATEQVTEIDASPAGIDAVDASVDDTAVLRPGDVVADPLASEPVAAPASDVRSTPVVRRPAASTSSGVPLWIMIAAGTAIALAVAWFAFGRALRERFTSPPATTPDAANELIDDLDITEESPIVENVDFPFDDDEIGSQSISLDADLGAGTGLQGSADLDVAQDFGFSGTTGENEAAMDLEFPAEPANEPLPTPTDIIEPSHRIEDALIAEEIPAAEDTQASEAVDDAGDYDFSMIVDATRQPVVEEVTAMDLMAVRVDDENSTADIGGQTLASDVDIAILEQDYEDEFTQTQALNDEIAKAAEELALRMQEDEDTAEVTSRIEQVEDPAMTATVESPVEAGNDDLTEIADLERTEIAGMDDIDDLERTEIADLEDTSVNLQLTENLHNPGNEVTVAMPQPDNELTVDMASPNNEPTVEMANPGNDATVEMPLESGAEDSKEPKAS